MTHLRGQVTAACPVTGATADAQARRESGLAEYCQGVTALGDGAHLDTGVVHRLRGSGRPAESGTISARKSP